MTLDEAKRLRVGMRVRITKSIAKSESAFGWASTKTKMAGTIQTIKKIAENYRRIYMDSGPGVDVSFHPNNLNFLTEEDYDIEDPKPVLFNPKQLNIEVN
jgi:hypothetical protein